MKKLTFLFFVLLCILHVNAQKSIESISELSNEKIYYIKSVNGTYLQASSDFYSEEIFQRTSINTSDKYAKWAIYNAGNYFYIYNIGKKEFTMAYRDYSAGMSYNEMPVYFRTTYYFYNNYYSDIISQTDKNGNKKFAIYTTGFGNGYVYANGENSNKTPLVSDKNNNYQNNLFDFVEAGTLSASDKNDIESYFIKTEVKFECEDGTVFKYTDYLNNFTIKPKYTKEIDGIRYTFTVIDKDYPAQTEIKPEKSGSITIKVIKSIESNIKILSKEKLSDELKRYSTVKNIIVKKEPYKYTVPEYISLGYLRYKVVDELYSPGTVIDCSKGYEKEIAVELVNSLSENIIPEFDYSLLTNVWGVKLKSGEVNVFPKQQMKVFDVEGTDYKITLLNGEIFKYSKDDVDSVFDKTPSYLPVFTEFKFNNKFNDHLIKDAKDEDVVIMDDKVNIKVSSIGRTFAPSFTLSDSSATAYILDKPQGSHAQRTRFNVPVTYTLAMPGSTLHYCYDPDTRKQPEKKIYTQFTLRFDKRYISHKATTSATTGKVTYTMSSSTEPTDIIEIGGKDEIFTLYNKTIGKYIVLNSAKSGFTYSDTPTEFLVYELDENNTAYKVFEITPGRKYQLIARSGLSYYTMSLKETSTQLSLSVHEHSSIPGFNYNTSSEYLVNFEEPLARAARAAVDYSNYVTASLPWGRAVTVYTEFARDNAETIPQLYINTDDNEPVNSRTEYKTATIKINGMGMYPNMDETELNIRGRGNSSWAGGGYNKNPYRLKFNTKQEPFGLKKGKSWVLLANRQDGSMTTNAIAHRLGTMVGAAGAMQIIPVDLYLNDVYMGNYNFCANPSISNNCIDIDESDAVMLDLDVYYDEPYKFMDTNYPIPSGNESIWQNGTKVGEITSLPVNIKFPDLEELKYSTSTTVANQKKTWIQNTWRGFTKILKNSNPSKVTDTTQPDAYVDSIDVDMLVRFMFVNELCDNEELYHPKSCKIYRENASQQGTKWVFGPIWDFDWGFGYDQSRTYFEAKATENFQTALARNNKFWTHLMNSRIVKRAYYNLWKDFIESGRLEEIIDYCSDYYDFNKLSFYKCSSSNYNYITYNAKVWLRERAMHIFENLDKGEDPNEGKLSTLDIVAVINGIKAGDNNPEYDINGDGIVNTQDIKTIVEKILSE